MNKKITIFFLLLLAAQSIIAQPKAGLQALRNAEVVEAPVAFRFGLYAASSKNYHSSQAHVFCCEDGCGVFGNGNGSGLSFGLLLEKPLFKMFDLTFGVNYADRSGDFGVSRVGNIPVLDEASGNYVTLQRQHSFTASLPEVVGTVGLKFTPLPSFPIYLGAGLGYSLPLGSSSNYRQTEEILSPSGVVYPETHSNFKVVGSGEIQDIKGSIGARGSIGYPLPLGKDISAAPEASYYLPLTKTRDDYQWKIASLEFGVALRYNIYKAVPPIAPPSPEPPPPPPPIKPIAPIAELTISPPQKIEIVETIVTETFPILPYLFFDSASSALSNRYDVISSVDRDRFRHRELPHSSLEAYYQILNVVGDRLSSDDSRKITITGTTDGKEVAAGIDATNLAQARAMSIKSYLIKAWGVAEDRIIIKTSAVPKYPSTKKFDEGVEENRRVEITANDPKVLEPIIHEKFSRYEGTPSQLPFVLKVTAKQPITKWDMNIKADDDVLYQTSGTGNPPLALNWKLSENALAPIAEAVDAKKPVKAQFSISDEAALANTKAFEIPAVKSRYPFELSRLSLIVFDFDKSDISPQNKEMVRTFVSHSITPNSTVQINGSTDRLGELDHNQELSQSRADAVAVLVKAQNPGVQLTAVKGIGPAEDASLNATPEGRYYCRTVTVQVQTPIK